MAASPTAASNKSALRRPRLSISGDWVFQPFIYACGLSILAVAAYLGIKLAGEAKPAFDEFGFSFLWGTNWNPVQLEFGALPAIVGTLSSAFLALIFAVPVAIGAAIFLTELSPGWLRLPATYVIETLASIPSVIFGLWALFILVPFVREQIQPFFIDYFSWIPVFDGPAFGISIFAAGLILAVMILPIVTSITREILIAVPNSQREAMLALGATKWEMISGAVLPYARSGVIGGVILGLGRALGETLAVTMVIGNSFRMPGSVFDPGQTIASGIASQFNEATAGVYIGSLIYLAFILLVIALVINIAARLLVNRLMRVPGRLRE
jgi:phosphate transport system permease protein